MKKLFSAIVLIGMLFLASSCKKDSNGNNIYKMNASIGGTQWIAPLPGGVLSSGVLVITGTSLTGETMVVTIKGETTGSYELNVLAQKEQCLGTYKATLTTTMDDTYVSASGKVLLTKVDKTNNLVSGTFEFDLANKSFAVKQITNGAFNDVTFVLD